MLGRLLPSTLKRTAPASTDLLKWILIAAAAALAGCSNEDENLLIGTSIQQIGNAALKRGCMSEDERSALFSLNSILQKRNSPHRIAAWELPNSPCRGERWGSFVRVE